MLLPARPAYTVTAWGDINNGRFAYADTRALGAVDVRRDVAVILVGMLAPEGADFTADVEARADERRSQSENKSVALRRLRLLLAIHVRTPVPVGEIGSGLFRSRVRNGRIACSPEHDDYPAMLAEALDVIAAARWDVAKAALRLGSTTSQLIKLVKDHPAALRYLNEQRRARGEHELK